jgi:hypothetical protein
VAGLTLEQARFFEEQALQMGVPAAWMADWLSRNPGDQHRILDAYAGEAGGQTAVAQAITQAGGLAYLDTLAPARPPDPPPASVGGAGVTASSFGGFSITSILVLALMAGAAWYLWKSSKG